MSERNQSEVAEPAIRVLEKGLSDIGDAYSVLASALASITAIAGQIVDGSTLTLRIAAHLIEACALAEKSVLLHGDEQADQRLLRALRWFQIRVIEAATRLDMSRTERAG